MSPKLVLRTPPPALMAPCPPADRRAWRTTRDIIGTATANEAALAQCAAQVDGIRAWSEAQK